MKVVAFTIDKYAYIEQTFWHFYQKFWPDNPYETVIMGQKKKLHLPCEIVYVGGAEMNFGGRMQKFLHHHYQERLLLLVMMDYIPNQPINDAMVRKAEILCQRDDIGHVRLRPYPHPQHVFKEDPDFGVIEPNSRYSLSLQPGIWDRKILMRLMKDGESAWHTETRGSSRTRALGIKFLSTQAHAWTHLNWFKKQAVNPDAPSWCKRHWDD